MLGLAGVQDFVDRTTLSKWQSLVKRIERKSGTFRSLTNAELRKASLAKRYEVLSGLSLDELVVDAAVLVREAAERAIGMRHYPVQLLGGIAMHFGSIAIMQTGEGKTLTATLPIYLAALTGRGAHLATANDYLAARDAELMRPVYDLLGMSVGVVQSDSSRIERKQAYAKDITYTTAKEIGFDFLRDRIFQRDQGELSTNGAALGWGAGVMAMLAGGTPPGDLPPVQREPNFVLVDEADSILIDEARTPLIVSSAPNASRLAEEAMYRWGAEHADQFTDRADFQIDPTTKQLTLTAAGRKKVRQIPKPQLLQQTPILNIYDQTQLAIHINQNFIRDRHYVIRDGEIVIVDEFTGRLAEGRKWRSGLHQAIEARENLEITFDSGEAARITIQDLFLRYPRLAGMTGTIANSSFELRKIYRVKVVEIPTNRPPKRVAWQDQIFLTEEAKWLAISREISELNRQGRPVLVGTRSIDKSERLGKLLDRLEVPHEVLNARHLAREADIIAMAGQVSRVTVATNMAGRGTDIKVSSAALDLGGLHVICSELHESARIDRQLIGRCGRQGDPGSFQQFMSLQDDVLKQGLGDKRAAAIREKYRDQPERYLVRQLPRLGPLFRSAQQKIEQRNFRSRQTLLHLEKQRREIQTEMGQDPYLDTAGA